MENNDLEGVDSNNGVNNNGNCLSTDFAEPGADQTSLPRISRNKRRNKPRIKPSTTDFSEQAADQAFAGTALAYQVPKWRAQFPQGFCLIRGCFREIRGKAVAVALAVFWFDPRLFPRNPWKGSCC